MQKRPFRPKLHKPIIALILAVLIILVSLVYSGLPPFYKNNTFVMWLSSPFNIYYETANNGIFYNFVIIVTAYFLIELYSRNLADLKGRDALIDNAFLMSIGASYGTSLLLWLLVGMPSIGTSIIGFTAFIFFAMEITDSELIIRLSTMATRSKYMISVALFAFATLVVTLFTIFFIYISSNSYWYVHIIGGLIFAQALFVYVLMHRIMRAKQPIL